MKKQHFSTRVRTLLLSAVMCMFSFAAHAQLNVTGTVTDENGEPLIGVSVLEKGTSNGVATDVDGNYALKVAKGKTIIFSYLGYENAEVVVNKAKNNVQLKPEALNLNEVVVVGYGSMRRKDVTSSITTVKADDLNKGVFTDAGSMLQGKVPGLVVSTTGDPNGGSSITLRGASTLRAGAMSPYYVVDGIPGVDISLVSPDDIESIDVLRDATATAIYGSKAANGVIIVTTKKGAKDRVNVNYNGYVGFDNILKKLDMCTADDLRNYAKAQGVTLKDGGANTNWQDEVLRTGVSHNHNLGINGGNQKIQYMASANIMQRNGVIKETGFTRFNFRSLLSAKVLKDHLTLSAGFNSMYGKHYGVPTKTEGASVLDAMNYFSPTNAVKDAKGNWTAGAGSKNYNPLALMYEDTSNTIWKRNQFIGKASLEIIKG
ncbi:MAG: SusC/RagA family TonB-linked outer membrane protein, partial [Bacteroidaceae bacterium]|nr:SusC/RagA family TonB-linked outer membrane protein [Bacteroidaceae bacterium]